MKRCTAVVTLLFVLLLLAPAVPASAHQNGCHSWHSCPSDSGSYVCGDRGYYTYCDDSNTTYEPDYSEQGATDGEDYLDSNHEFIRSNAATNGAADGKSDAENDNGDNPSPDNTDTCDDIKYSNSSLPSEYYDAFEDAYKAGCGDAYDEAYTAAYENAYSDAEQATKNEQELADTDPVSESKSGPLNAAWVWGLLAIGFGVPTLIYHRRSK